MQQYTILVADDEPILLNMVEKLLRKDDYNVIKADSAAAVMKSLKEEAPDLLLLDINLPDKSGLELCKDIRADHQFIDIPIVFLTGAAASPDDVAEALNAGGDDYIHKPFAARELSARLRAQLRRARVQRDVGIPHLRFVMDTYQVYVDGQEVDLTRVEFNLLAHMSKTPNEWKSTRVLLAEVWRYPGNVGDAALVRNHVRNLRRKLESDPSRPAIILSRHRRGYMVKAHVEMATQAPS